MKLRLLVILFLIASCTTCNSESPSRSDGDSIQVEDDSISVVDSTVNDNDTQTLIDLDNIMDDIDTEPDIDNYDPNCPSMKVYENVKAAGFPLKR